MQARATIEDLRVPGIVVTVLAAAIALWPATSNANVDLRGIDGTAHAPLSADHGQTPPAPPSAPSAPTAPTPPVSSDAVVGRTDEGPGAWWAYIKADRVTGNRATDDPRFSALREGGPVFWFVRDKREYVVRDAATLREVEQIVAPIEALGASQKAAAGSATTAETDRLTAQVERQIAGVIARTLADGRATPLKTQ